MHKDALPPDKNAELAAFRRQIDEYDDRIIQLLIERTKVVERVGEFKRRTAPGQCPIRPGREAQQVRRIMQCFEGSLFQPAAAAAIWRLIIGASTSVEAPLPMSVYAPDRNNDLTWMGREYFGPFLPVIRQPHVKRVIGDIMDGKAAIGIVPMLRGDDTTYWWTNLMEQGSHIPRIFARIPFICNEQTGRDAPSALVIANVSPEASGDDVSILVIEADHHVSQSRLQTAFMHAKLEVTWINVATLHPGARHHLVEIKGFITQSEPRMQALLSALSSSIFHVRFLGAYATPVTLNPKHPHENSASSHAHTAKA